MRYLKMVGLLAVAAAALMAFTGSASATTVTNGSTGLATSITAVNEGALTFNTPSVAFNCSESTLAVPITTNAAKDAKGNTLNAGGPVTGLTFTGCNHHFEDPVATRGTLSVTSAGTVFSNGLRATVLFTTIFGEIHCVLETKNTHIGTVTDAPTHTTGHATLHIASAAIPINAELSRSASLCGSSWTLTGSYKFTSPTGLTVD